MPGMAIEGRTSLLRRLLPRLGPLLSCLPLGKWSRVTLLLCNAL